MGDQQNPSAEQIMIIQLEVVSEDEYQMDIADIDEVGRSLFEELRKSGYTVTPAQTGRKGGEPLLDVLLQVPQFLYKNKDLLLAMFESVTLVLKCLFIARDRRAEIEKAKRTPLNFTLLVDGRPLAIETTDAADAAKLIADFQKIYPHEAKKVTPQSKITIKTHVSKKKRRGSH